MDCPDDIDMLIKPTNREKLQKLEELVAQTQAALEKEEKARKEVEALNAKLIQEKTDLLRSLEGEKGSLSSFQEKVAKLQAQKTDLESQLLVSKSIRNKINFIKHFLQTST